MSTLKAVPQPQPQTGQARRHIVNDLSIQVATVNGSGSQSSNNVLMRSIFQMGIPVSGKNLFPSNIAGLPTWFTIRASSQGYLAPKREIDLLIAMNPETAREDLASLPPGRLVIYEEKLRLSRLRDDVHFYPVPFSKLAAQIIPNARLRKLVANMIYVGAAAELLSIDMKQVERAIAKWFKTKQKAIDFNVKAAHLGAQYVRDNLPRQDLYRFRPMNATQGKIIIDGNTACALGCLYAGVTVATWYPITPSSSLCEALTVYAERFRKDEQGRATFAIVQAEDELAAVGMALGAGWAGARAMTSTSGPGISLMAEFVGLGYFAEVPCVIFDVQRVGPSTGLPTRTSQGDIIHLHYLSHGDTAHPVLFPSDMKECFEFSQIAFDLAERLQQPVFVATDLDLGMNNFMSDVFDHPTAPLDRGKVLSAQDLECLGQFARYRDVDGDGIPYRALPGTEHRLAPYLTRGSGRNERGQYSERPEDFTNQMKRLSRKMETARKLVPEPIVDQVEETEVGLLFYGSTESAIQEFRDQLAAEYGLKVSTFRARALPLSDHLRAFVDRHRTVYVVEQNRDGQMAQLVKLEVPTQADRIRSIVHFTGHPIDARFITDQIAALEQSERIQ